MNRVQKAVKAFTKYHWNEMGGLPSVIDCGLSRLFFGTGVEEYVAMEFYRKSYRERNTYLTSHRHQKINARFLKDTTAEQRSRVGNKLEFNRFFSDFVHRRYLETAVSSPEEITAFVDRFGTVLAKPLNSTQGKGILKIERPELNPEMTEKLIRGKYLLEEFIVQHPDIARINPTSVNTVRIATALDKKGGVHVIGACLRCGGEGSYLDNTHSGGIGYPIDTENGIVIGPGKDRNTSKRYVKHPGSNTVMPGLQIPNWDILIDRLTQAARSIPELPYLGWDIAVTKDGVEFIEANYGHSGVGIQSDNIGKYRMVKEALAGQVL